MKFWLLLLSSGLMASALAVPNHKVKGEHLEKDAEGAFAGRHHGEDGHDFDHEAILGSHKEAEEYDELSPEESKRRLAILLRRMDVNSDKLISKAELRQWIITSFQSLSQEESHERFEDGDGNKDGFITWPEFLAEEYDLGDESTVDEELEKMRMDPEREEEFSIIGEEKVLFKSADESEDGKLSREEFFAFTHPEETERLFPAVVDNMLRERDGNNDGVISFEEFVAPLSKGKDQEWKDQEKTRFDEELDKDHDGSLNRSEIQDWMIPSSEGAADEEVEHLFGEADADKDDSLTFHEVLDNHETFVGSEATDYGDQLENIHRYMDDL